MSDAAYCGNENCRRFLIGKNCAACHPGLVEEQLRAALDSLDTLKEALAVAHKFAGDMSLWCGYPRVPVAADWLVVHDESERVKEVLAEALEAVSVDKKP